MEDEVRNETARDVAESYAPAPQDGFDMYGLIGIILAGLAMFAFAGFYDVDLSSRPLLIVAIAASSGAAALLLRVVRKRRHNNALRTEYEKARL